MAQQGWKDIKGPHHTVAHLAVGMDYAIRLFGCKILDGDRLLGPGAFSHDLESLGIQVEERKKGGKGGLGMEAGGWDRRRVRRERAQLRIKVQDIAIGKVCWMEKTDERK